MHVLNPMRFTKSNGPVVFSPGVSIRIKDPEKVIVTLRFEESAEFQTHDKLLKLEQKPVCCQICD